MKNLLPLKEKMSLENYAVLLSTVSLLGLLSVLCASFMRIWPENLAADVCIIGLVLLFGIGTLALCVIALQKKQELPAKIVDFSCFAVAGLTSFEIVAHHVSEQMFGYGFPWLVKMYFIPLSVVFVCGLGLKFAAYIKKKIFS